MNENPRKTSSLPCTVFPVQALAKVDNERPNNKPPAKVTKTMFGIIEWECIRMSRIDGITDETASCVGKEADHEEECEVVGIPEDFERLMANITMSSGVHKEHNKKHEMSCNASRLRIVNLLSELLS